MDSLILDGQPLTLSEIEAVSLFSARVAVGAFRSCPRSRQPEAD
jgi:hypothetical protein